MAHEKSEKLLSLASDVAVAVMKAEQDGHFGVEDVAFFVPLLAQISPAISALSGLGDEIKSMSVSDIIDLASAVLAKLGGVVSEKSAAVVKQSLVVAIESAKLVSLVKQ